MGRSKKELVVVVKPYMCKCHLPGCTLHDGRQGYGVTAGGRWHAYLFATTESAQRFADSVKVDEQSIRVNVGYPAPFAWSKW